jgi:hypothetical protein
MKADHNIELKEGDIVRYHSSLYPDMSLRTFVVYRVFRSNGLICEVGIEMDGLVWHCSPDDLTIERISVDK